MITYRLAEDSYTAWTTESVTRPISAWCTAEQLCTKLRNLGALQNSRAPSYWLSRHAPSWEISTYCRVVVYRATCYLVLLCSALSYRLSGVALLCTEMKSALGHFIWSRQYALNFSAIQCTLYIQYKNWN